MFPILLSVYIALTPLNTPYPPVLDCIVSHESGGNQFASNGEPLISTTGDIGIFQINIKTWSATAKTMGLDLSKEKDNIEFGYWLFTTHGPKEWVTYRKYCEQDTS